MDLQYNKYFIGRNGNDTKIIDVYNITSNIAFILVFYFDIYIKFVIIHICSIWNVLNFWAHKNVYSIG